MTEGKALLDPIYVGVMNSSGAGQAAAPFSIFGLEQMALARAGAQHLSAGSDLEPLGSGFLCFDAFWTSHKKSDSFLEKGRAI